MADEELQRKQAERGEEREAEPVERGGKPRRPLERAFGPLIDRLLLGEGAGGVDTESSELSLRAFYLALKDGFDARQRNASGDYRPDPKSERFPEFERPKSKPSELSPRGQPKASLIGLVEDWWKEAQAAGRRPSTHGATERQ